MPDYPPAWYTFEIQREVHERAGWQCEHCKMQFPRGDTRAIYATNKDGKPAVLTVHHLDGNPANNDWTNLLAVCQACHLHIQAVWAPGEPLPPSWDGPPAWLVERGLSYLPTQQRRLMVVDLVPLSEEQIAQVQARAVQMYKAWQTVEDQAREWDRMPEENRPDRKRPPSPKTMRKRLWTYLYNLGDRDPRLFRAARNALQAYFVNSSTNDESKQGEKG